MQLTLVVADFFPHATSLAASAEHLPELPGLASMLRFGSSEPAGERWRTWLAQELGRTDLAALPPAQVAALAAGAHLQGAQPWFASPVHLLAGIDHLRLHPAGLLQLEPAEGARLAADFDTVFGAAGQRLVPLCGGLLLEGLRVPPSLLATDRDPARWLGANIAPAQLGVAPVVRSMTAELEMWLHDHALNQRRARSGQLAVNSLWLWGGDALPGPASAPVQAPALGAVSQSARVVPPSPSARVGPPSPSALAEPPSPGRVRVYGGDGFVAGLCAACGLPPPELAPSFARLAGERAGSLLVVVSAAASDARDAPLLRLERDWFLPALATLRAGGLSQLRVHMGERLVTLRRPALRRFWRRARPWWQGLSQV